MSRLPWTRWCSAAPTACRGISLSAEARGSTQHVQASSDRLTQVQCDQHGTPYQDTRTPTRTRSVVRLYGPAIFTGFYLVPPVLCSKKHGIHSNVDSWHPHMKRISNSNEGVIHQESTLSRVSASLSSFSLSGHRADPMARPIRSEPRSDQHG